MTFAVNPERAKLERVAEWDAVNKQRISFTIREKELRELVVSDNADVTKIGTQNKTLDDKFKLKIVIKENYGFEHPNKATDDKLTAADAADDMCEAILKASPNEGAFIVDRLVKWEPKLSKSEYDKLSPALKAIADKYIKISPGTPTAEIVEVKPK